MSRNMAWGVGPYFPMPLFFGVYMFKQVICRSCDGDGCIKCDGNGIRYIEIDDPTLALQDEISELKRQLEIAKEALKFYAENCTVDDFQSDCEGDLAREALKDLESAGE